MTRGWWPGESESVKRERGELKLKAMEGLKDETFVVTEEHFEWVFEEDDDLEDFGTTGNIVDDETAAASSSVRVTIPTQDEGGNQGAIQYVDEVEGGNEIEEEGVTLDDSSIISNQPDCDKLSSCTPSATTGNNISSSDLNTVPAEPQCFLILPTHLQSSCQQTSCDDFMRTSNECAICMIEYDVGDVVIYSTHCRHAFHQDCILDWFSREKTQCPSCREVFWDPKGEAEGKKSNAGVSSGDTQGGGSLGMSASASRPTESNLGNRARISTEDTEVLSTLGESPSFDAESTILGNGSSSRGNSTDSALEPVNETREERTEEIPAAPLVAA